MVQPFQREHHFNWPRGNLPCFLLFGEGRPFTHPGPKITRNSKRFKIISAITFQSKLLEHLNCVTQNFKRKSKQSLRLRGALLGGYTWAFARKITKTRQIIFIHLLRSIFLIPNRCKNGYGLRAQITGL